MYCRFNVGCAETKASHRRRGLPNKVSYGKPGGDEADHNQQKVALRT